MLRFVAGADRLPPPAAERPPRLVPHRQGRQAGPAARRQLVRPRRHSRRLERQRPEPHQRVRHQRPRRPGRPRRDDHAARRRRAAAVRRAAGSRRHSTGGCSSTRPPSRPTTSTPKPTARRPATSRSCWSTTRCGATWRSERRRCRVSGVRDRANHAVDVRKSAELNRARVAIVQPMLDPLLLCIP